MVTTPRTWSWAPLTKSRPRATFPPLKVLFCGSDAFSIPSFTVLRELQLRRSDVVSHLGIVVPCAKPAGRGMKQLRPVPLAILSEQFKYPVAQVAEFEMTPINIPSVSRNPSDRWDVIIAVSFGHKISHEVLQRTTFGGLNIHPSLLPRHRGAAPLHRALLQNDKETGVSIQTIHPHEFDKGDILMQSPPEPILPSTTLQSLSSKLSHMGSEMLRDLLMQGYPSNVQNTIQHLYKSSYAPKVKKQEQKVLWDDAQWTSQKLARWSSVMGYVWTLMPDGITIVKLSDIGSVSKSDYHQRETYGKAIMQNRDLESGQTQKRLLVKCVDGHIEVGKIQIAGKKQKLGAEAAELHGIQFSV